MHNEGFVSLYFLPQDHVIRMGNGFDAKLLQIRSSGCITGAALVWFFILCNNCHGSLGVLCLVGDSVET